MHQPGYVQGGQEVGRNYLLLRIHVRRIRGIDITTLNVKLFQMCVDDLLLSFDNI
jgi:hypothetical protein